VKLSRAERGLLKTLALLDGGEAEVRGPNYRTAQRLEAKGLVRIGVGGSGVAYQGRWWWTAAATEAGLAEARAIQAKEVSA
jgi:hypothetical protein